MSFVLPLAFCLALAFGLDFAGALSPSAKAVSARAEETANAAKKYESIRRGIVSPTNFPNRCTLRAPSMARSGKKLRSATMSIQSGPRDFPLIRLESLDEQPPSTEAPFLRLVRRRLRAHYPDGKISPPFTYDEVDRRAIDAVVIAAHYVGPGGKRRVFLRSAL